MTSTAAEMIPTAKAARNEGTNDTTATRTRRARTSSDEEANGSTRYFLAKPNGSDDQPAFDREVANEGEALVEALRLGVSFYVVQEFRAIADFSGRKPQLNKEAVRPR